MTISRQRGRWRRSLTTAAAALTVLVTATPDQARADVWEAHASWNQEWENRFANWVRSSVTPEMALSPEREYRRQKLDCADLIYYLRAVFSYENRLDFAATDGQGRTITHRSRAFDTIADEEQRVNEFLKRLLLVTNTATLARDSALVPIDRDSIRSGTFLATDTTTNHVWLVKDIGPNGIPDLLSSTEPASEFIYPAYSFPTGHAAFSRSGTRLSSARGGFRRFLRPAEIGASARPAHAIEQTRIPIESFFETIQERLAERAEGPEQRHDRKLDELCLQMRIRTNIVTDAALALRAHRTLAREQLSALSTPSRDARIRSLIEELRVEHLQLQATGARTPIWEKSRRYLVDAGPVQLLSESELRGVCLVQWAENRIEPLASLVRRFEFASPDASATLELRWGGSPLLYGL